MGSSIKRNLIRALCTLLCSFFLLTTCALAAPLPTLRVGYTDIPGYLSRDDQYYYHGIAYEYLEAIATYLGVRLEYIPGTAEENALRLQLGIIDMMPQQDSHAFTSVDRPTVPTAVALQTIPLGPGAGFLLLPSPHYRLTQQIQASIQDISQADPFFLYQVREKYHSYTVRPLNLTSEEQEYLQQHPVIRAMSAPGEAPYSWFKNGEHQGIVADITRIIEQDLGIRIEVIPTDTQGEMLQHLADGDIPLVTDIYFDYNWGRQHNALLTAPYLTLNYVSVMRRSEKLPDKPIIACPRDHFCTYTFIEKNYPISQLRYYGTIAECMAAVNNREADMTFAKSITAQSDIHQGAYYNLYTDGNVVFSHKVSLAVNEQADPILIRILNKEIDHISQQDIASIVDQAVYADQDQETLQSMLYRNPFGLMLYLVLIFTVIILFLLVVLSMRRRHAQELYRQANTVIGSDLHNTRWFAANLLDCIQHAQADQQAGRLFLLVLSVHRMSTLRELYGSRSFEQAVKDGLAKIIHENSWILLHGLSAEATHAFALCRAPDGMSIEQSARHLLQIAGTVVVNGTPTSFTYRMGIYPIPADGPLDSRLMMDNAQLAHDNILLSDQDIAIFNADIHRESLLQKQMEQFMEKALQNDEFKVYLQPKYNIAAQTTCGTEALIRWDSPELGFLMPDQFIDLFERNGFAIQLDYYMLDHIFRWQRAQLDKGQPVLPISVNQSALHITEEDYLENMQLIADQYQLPAELVELEITETAFIDFTTKSERDNSYHIIQTLKQMGFSLSMDDFCTGYSSIAMLQTLPVNTMKIDRSMLYAAETSARSLTILQHIIELGRDLGMNIIVEGIETRQQELLLLSIGCSTGQGFLFGRPMPCEVFPVFLQEKTAASTE